MREGTDDLRAKAQAARGVGTSEITPETIEALLSKLEKDQTKEEHTATIWRALGTVLGYAALITVQIALVLLGMKLGMSFEWAALLVILTTLNIGPLNNA